MVFGRNGLGIDSLHATLVNVDPALIEAAKLDGANIFQRIWHIDLPALKPVMVIQFILAAGVS